MNKEAATAWTEAITELLTGQELVIVEVPVTGRPRVRVKQAFREAHVFEWNGNCTISVTDTTGVWTGLTDFEIDPEARTIHAQNRQAVQHTRAAWTVLDRGEDTYQKMLDAEETVHRAGRKKQESGNG